MTTFKVLIIVLRANIRLSGVVSTLYFNLNIVMYV